MRGSLKPLLLSMLVLVGGCTSAGGERPAVQHFPVDASIARAVQSSGARPPFSSAVRVGDILYLSGQIGTRPDGTLPEGIAAQSRQTMENIGAVLTRAGLGWSDVFHCLVMIDNISDWQAFNAVYVGYFPPGRLPARSALGADGLALGALVEVECKAHAPAKAR
jgi:reactive intermediate/imine deaminase